MSMKLETPVQYLKGVGPKISAKLSKLGIHRVDDLITYFPRAWEDRRQIYSLKEARFKQEGTFRGEITSLHFKETRLGLCIVEVILQDKSGQLPCKWIRRKSFHYDVFQTFKNELTVGSSLLVYGKIQPDFYGPTLSVEEHAILKNGNLDSIHINRIVPIYPTTEGVQIKLLRKLIYDLLQSTPIEDPTPSSFKKTLTPLNWALKEFHFPHSFEEKNKARDRLAFQEHFYFQTVLALIRKNRKVTRTTSYEIKRTLLTPFKEKCGFDFTSSQKKAIREIFNDLTSLTPMNRLLQGDVGSGKTVVALSAMLLASENKIQSVLMAPTEILAEQHTLTLKHWLESLPVKVGLLTGSTKPKERKKFLEGCSSGEIDIAIGTHALLEKEVQFARCGLIVIDEQHRFGVRHRLALLERKPIPDVLVMTATPIPRTLTLGIYGDIDVSTLLELPPGRQKVETILRTEAEAYKIVKEEVEKKRQAFIVYPLVDESNKIELKSAIKEYERLKKEIFPELSLGLLHGQMSGINKEKIMRDFHKGKFSILVSTTVIEVGIDVPTATVMVIQNAERFGLSTLHQLRGRVGRGEFPSRCILVAQPKSEVAAKRIEICQKTNNGFELAEADLLMRGPGEIFGTTQHGLPNFKVADFATDKELILKSQTLARDLVEKDPALQWDENKALRETLRQQFSQSWHWAKIA